MKSLRSAGLIAAIAACFLSTVASAQSKFELRGARAESQKAVQVMQDAQKRADFEAALPARMDLVDSIVNQYSAEFLKDGWDGVARMSHFAMTVHATPSEVLKSARAAKSISEFIGMQGLGLSRLDIQKAALGDTANLVFLAIGPCRIADSRFSSGGALTGNVIRTYRNFASAGQGGASGCNTTTGISSGSPGAIAMNIAVVVPSHDGNLVARPAGNTNTTASANFVAGQIISNATVIKMTGTAGAADFELLPVLNGSPSSTHIVLDLLGFYVPSEPAALDCVDATGSTPVTTGLSASASATCGAGFSLTGGSCDTYPSSTSYITETNMSGSTFSCLAGRPSSGLIGVDLVTARCCRTAGTNVGRF